MDGCLPFVITNFKYASSLPFFHPLSLFLFIFLSSVKISVSSKELLLQKDFPAFSMSLE